MKYIRIFTKVEREAASSASVVLQLYVMRVQAKIQPKVLVQYRRQRVVRVQLAKVGQYVSHSW